MKQLTELLVCAITFCKRYKLSAFDFTYQNHYFKILGAEKGPIRAVKKFVLTYKLCEKFAQVLLSEVMKNHPYLGKMRHFDDTLRECQALHQHHDLYAPYQCAHHA